MSAASFTSTNNRLARTSAPSLRAFRSAQGQKSTMARADPDPGNSRDPYGS